MYVCISTCICVRICVCVIGVLKGVILNLGILLSSNGMRSRSMSLYHISSGVIYKQLNYLTPTLVRYVWKNRRKTR